MNKPFFNKKQHNFNKAPQKKTFYNNSKNAGIAEGFNKLKNSGDRETKVLNYQRDVIFDIKFNGVKIGKLTIDFIVAYANGKLEHIYTKQLKPGPEREFFLFKKRMIEIQYGIDIIEQ